MERLTHYLGIALLGLLLGTMPARLPKHDPGEEVYFGDHESKYTVTGWSRWEERDGWYYELSGQWGICWYFAAEGE